MGKTRNPSLKRLNNYRYRYKIDVKNEEELNEWLEKRMKEKEEKRNKRKSIFNKIDPFRDKSLDEYMKEYLKNGGKIKYIDDNKDIVTGRHRTSYRISNKMKKELLK